MNPDPPVTKALTFASFERSRVNHMDEMPIEKE